MQAVDFKGLKLGRVAAPPVAETIETRLETQLGYTDGCSPPVAETIENLIKCAAGRGSAFQPLQSLRLLRPVLVPSK